jgi:hypothetical protein
MISHNYLNYNDLITETNINPETNILYDIFYITTDILYNERKCKSIINKNVKDNENNTHNANDANNNENSNNTQSNMNDNKEDNSSPNEENKNKTDEENGPDKNTQKDENNNSSDDTNNTANNINDMNSNINNKGNIDKLIHKLFKNISLNLHPDKGNKTNHFAISVASKEKKDLSKLIYIYILNNLDTSVLKLTQSDVEILKVEKDKLTTNLTNIKTIATYLTTNS